jgi:Zn finger protein HypA/HybF involved in hydrogenase expression
MARICRACRGRGEIYIYRTPESAFIEWAADEIPNEIPFETERVCCPDCHGLGMVGLRSDDRCTVMSLAIDAATNPF